MSKSMTDAKPHNRDKNYRIKGNSPFRKALGVSNEAGEVKARSAMSARLSWSVHEIPAPSLRQNRAWKYRR